MYRKKVYIRGDYWKTSKSFKQPEYYTGRVTSRTSHLNVDGHVVWTVSIDGWKPCDVREDELARTLDELKVIASEARDDEKRRIERYGAKFVKVQEKAVELYSDRTWKGECEIVNVTGNRKGLLCNSPFYTYKNNIKICRLHANSFIDVTEDVSEYEEGEADEFDTSDDDFIAEEDDGTKIINGKVLVEDIDDDSGSETKSDDEYNESTLESDDCDHLSDDYDEYNESSDDEPVIRTKKRRRIEESESDSDEEIQKIETRNQKCILM